MELSGKVAIVTGGASGIGRRTAELFVEEGARVVIADIDQGRGQELAESLGDAALFQRTDVAVAEDVQSLVDAAISTFGGLHVMFNNAGIMCDSRFRFLDDQFDDFAKVMNVNLLGVMLGSQLAARHMAKNGGGSIINTSSIAGIQPGFAFLKYRATKAAVVNFSQSIAIDLAEYDIRVNCLAPGHIRTEMSSFAPPGMDEETSRKLEVALAPVWSSNQPLKRRAVPEDVAQTALFLASDRSRYISGIVLPVDGAITAGDPVNHLQALMDARAKALAG